MSYFVSIYYSLWNVKMLNKKNIVPAQGKALHLVLCEMAKSSFKEKCWQESPLQHYYLFLHKKAACFE